MSAFFDFLILGTFMGMLSPFLGPWAQILALLWLKSTLKSKNQKKLTLSPRYHWDEGICPFLALSDCPVPQKTVCRGKFNSVFAIYGIPMLKAIGGVRPQNSDFFRFGHRM